MPGGGAEVGGDDVDVALPPGTAHGHVGQFSAAPVLQGVGAVRGRALAAMSGHGIAVGEPLGPDVVGAQAQLGPVRGSGD